MVRVGPKKKFKKIKFFGETDVGEGECEDLLRYVTVVTVYHQRSFVTVFDRRASPLLRRRGAPKTTSCVSLFEEIIV